MAKRNPLRTPSEHQRELARLLRQVAGRHSLWQVFRDFVAMAALAMSNGADRAQAEAREVEYLGIVKRYDAADVGHFSEAFAHVVMALELGPSDFLGSLFMALELSDSWKGQFFTPYELCRAMSRMNFAGGDVRRHIEAKGFITVNDPCVGAGALVIAAAESLMEQGFNYQRQLHVTAQDIDIVAVHMAYIQLSLLHIPAVVIHGNTLAGETRSTWFTLAHTSGFWRQKLARVAQLADASEGEPEHAVPSAVVATAPAAPEASAVPDNEHRRPAAGPVPEPAKHPPTQFALF